MQVTALVLAGGQSRRMGQDKLSLPRTADGRSGTVLEHVVETACLWANPVLLLTHPDTYSRAGTAELLPDPYLHRGPLAALSNAWTHPAVQNGDAVLVLAGDLPGLSPVVVEALLAALASREARDGAVVVRDGQAQPLLAVYRPPAGVRFRAAVRAGETRLMRAAAQLQLAAVDATELGWPEWWTRPVHTPEDYEAWIREGRSCG